MYIYIYEYVYTHTYIHDTHIHIYIYTHMGIRVQNHQFKVHNIDTLLDHTTNNTTHLPEGVNLNVFVC